MTDRTGLRSISTFRPVIGQRPQLRARRAPAVVARLSRRRNERFRASISGHSGLGAHIRRRTRLAGISTHQDRTAGYGPAFNGLPLILRRFIRRTRQQAPVRGSIWPAAQSQFRRAAIASGGEGIPLDEPAVAIERGFVEDDLREPLIEETPGEEWWRTDASAHSVSDMLVRRHTDFLGREALPPTQNLDASSASWERRGSLSAGLSSPFTASLRRADERIGDRAFRAYFAVNAPRRSVLGEEDRRGEQLSGEPAIAEEAVLSPTPPFLRAERRGGLATSRVLSSLAANGQTVQNASPALPSARQAFEHAFPQRFPLRTLGRFGRDAAARVDRFTMVRARIASPAALSAMNETASEQALGSHPFMRGQLAFASATPGQQSPRDAEDAGDAGSRPSDSWSPFLPAHAPLRSRASQPDSGRDVTSTMSHPAMEAWLPAPPSAPPSTTWESPATRSMARRLSNTRDHADWRPSAISESWQRGRTGAADQPPLHRFERVVAMRRPSTDLRPLAQRVAAHDEPFAPATRLMHAAAIAHVLRRLPPTVATPSLAERLAERQQPDWPRPQRNIDLPGLPESGQSMLFREFLRSLSLPSAPGAAASMATESTVATIFALPASSVVARSIAMSEPAPLPLQRLPGEITRLTEQPTVRWAGSMAATAGLSDEGVRRELARLSPVLRGRPDVIARKFAEFLGATSPSAAPVGPWSPTRRAQPISTTFAPVFAASALPAPSPRQPSGQSVAAGRSLVDPTLSGWLPEQHDEGASLSPFIARQVARAVNDPRIVSPMPLSLLIGRLQSHAGQGATSSPAPSPAQAARRSSQVDWPASAVLSREAAQPIVRPRRASPVIPGAAHDIDTPGVSFPGPHWPFAAQEAVDLMARFDEAPPVTQGFPGFPLAGRRQASLRSTHNQAGLTNSGQIDGLASPVQRAGVHRSAVRGVFRQAPTGPSFGPPPQGVGEDAASAFLGLPPSVMPPARAGASRATASFDLPRFVRHAVAQRASFAPPEGGLVTRPLVFRSALPSANEPTLAQRTQAAEAMAQSSGQPLPPLVRRSMEHLFRMDLATVRVHSGPHAARATDLVAARAMASGADVFLPGGVSDSPQSADLPLLAHELTHVAHHFGHRPPSSTATAPLTLAHRTAATEHDAEQVERVMADTIRRQPAEPSAPAALTLARKPAPVTIMRVDESTPAPSSSSSSTPSSAAAAPAGAGATPSEPSKQDQQKLADQIFHMLEQRLIVARERGGHRL